MIKPLKRVFIERCWTLVGRRRGPFWLVRRVQSVDGNPSSVEFDPRWVLEREEARGDILGFYHTHPSSITVPSVRDSQTMHGWVSAFGKPLLCLIEANNQVESYLYEDDTSGAVLLTACERFHRGFVVIFDNRSRGIQNDT
jgi:proteasome lid subunit RPN8/RPN11